MPRVAIANLILTTALIVALLLATSAISLYAGVLGNIRHELQLRNVAYVVANTIQQLYIITNSSDLPPGSEMLTKVLRIPPEVEEHAYEIEVELGPSGAGSSSQDLTVTATNTGTQHVSASVTVPIGSNIIWNQTSAYSNPNLRIAVSKLDDLTLQFAFTTG